MADVRLRGSDRFLPGKVDLNRNFISLRVKDYRPFLRACDRAGKETKREVRETFRKIGDIVRVDAEHRFEKYDAQSAAGFRTRVRQRGVAVEQSYKKTTGKRPDYGALQMRKALLPATVRNRQRIELQFSRALDKVADHFEKQ